MSGIARRLIGVSAGGFNPEARLTLSREIPVGPTDFTNAEKQSLVVMACDITFPATPSDGVLFHEGVDIEGWGDPQAYVCLRDGGSTLRIRAGDAYEPFYIDVAPPPDTRPHTLVWEFDPEEATIRAWLDGVALLPLVDPGFGNLLPWANSWGGGAFGNNAAHPWYPDYPDWGAPWGEPAGPWPGTILSTLRVYLDQKAGIGIEPDRVIFANTTYAPSLTERLVSPLDALTTLQNVFVSDISCDEPINIQWEERETFSPAGASYKISVNGGAYQDFADALTLPAGQYHVAINGALPFPGDRHARPMTRPAFLFNERTERQATQFFRWSRNALHTSSSARTVVIPAGVTSISAVAIGSGGEGIFASGGTTGGAGGGALSHSSNIAVTPGEALTMEISFPRTGTFSFADRWAALRRGATFLLRAEAGWNPSGQTGGIGGRASAGIGAVRRSGGRGGDGTSSVAGGSGGAAGYAGNGGNGAAGSSPQVTPGAQGSGGGGAGGSNASSASFRRDGGGVWYQGQGVNGVASQDAGGRGSQPGEDGTTRNKSYGGGSSSTSSNSCVYFSY